MVTINDLLSLAVSQKGSDLHISAGLVPRVRIDGQLCAMAQSCLDPNTIKTLLYTIITDRQRAIYEKQGEIDFAYTVSQLGRFRVHLFKQHRGCAAVFRIIAQQIPALSSLHLPLSVQQLTQLSSGLVLITGATGSGKSTTLAAILDDINQKQSKHIITIEDPIEFIHDSQQSLINQRQLDADTLCFDNALRAALRADPDIILIGELRDLQTIRLALTAAETGHLVLATLHTTSAANSIDRIVDVFTGDEKAMVRTLLSSTLQAVVAQTLLPKVGGGRIGAYEVMVCTPAIRHLIREGKTPQLYCAIQTGQAQGMQTLAQSLQHLLSQHHITKASALQAANHKTVVTS